MCSTPPPGPGMTWTVRLMPSSQATSSTSPRRRRRRWVMDPTAAAPEPPQGRLVGKGGKQPAVDAMIGHGRVDAQATQRQHQIGFLNPAVQVDRFSAGRRRQVAKFATARRIVRDQGDRVGHARRQAVAGVVSRAARIRDRPQQGDLPGIHPGRKQRVDHAGDQCGQLRQSGIDGHGDAVAGNDAFGQRREVEGIQQRRGHRCGGIIERFSGRRAALDNLRRFAAVPAPPRCSDRNEARRP